MSRRKQLAGSVLFRLTMGYLFVAVVFAAAWGWSLYAPLNSAVLKQQRNNLTAVAQSAALVAAQPGVSAGAVADQLVTRTDLRLTIVAADGSVLADSDQAPSTMENHGSRPEVAAALRGEVGTDQRISATEGSEQLYVAVPGSLDGSKVVIRVAQPITEIKKIASDSRRAGLIMLFAALAIAGAIAARVTRAATRPAADLTAAASRMAAGDLETPLPDVPSDLAELAGAIGELRDQTRARLEALDAERRTLAMTLDGLQDAVVVVKNDRAILWNRAAEHMLGATEGRWRDAELAQMGLPGPVESALSSMLSQESPSSIELAPDPTGRALRLTVSPLTPTDDSNRAIMVISDITARIKVERVRRDFVANASHELKTPVAGIKLLAESASQAAEDGDTSQALSFTAQIAAETERLGRLVADLLDLSRLESTDRADAIANVRESIDRALISHRAAAVRRGLTLELDLESMSAEDIYVALDPTDLAVALDNLLDNAIAYTDSGSVTVSVEGSTRSIDIAVADSGDGVSAEHLDRIFERFYRVDHGRSRDVGGTGLGLALVRHVAESSGGSVTVDSKPGSGSRFTLHLPRAT